jgi:hypothetical protein
MPAVGPLGVMPSGQDSITNNTTGLRKIYRGSKAALNLFMRNYAARQADTDRALLLMTPGPDLGGDDGAPYTVREAISLIVDVPLLHLGTMGLVYLDRFGRPVLW